MRVPVVFFYRSRVDRFELIESLKVVLCEFPLFEGRLKQIDKDLILDCNNQGVSFISTESKSSIESLIDNLQSSSKQELVTLIDASKSVSSQSPILTIKITYCSCGGMAMGICWHHAIGDMFSLIQLLKAWSATINKEKFDPPLITEDREQYIKKYISKNKSTESAVRHLDMWELIKLTFYLIFKAKSRKMIRIYFSEYELENIKQDFSKKSKSRLSRNDALCAYLSKSISELDSPRAEQKISIAINYRKSIDLDANILGNFISMINIKEKGSIQDFELAKSIRESINEFKSSHMNYLSTEQYVNKYGGAKKPGKFLNKSFDPLSKTLMITNWNKLGIYDVIFGGSKPYFFSFYGIIPIPWLSYIAEGFTEEGLIYSVVLPKKIAKEFLKKDHLDYIHRYRAETESLPKSVRELTWIH